ncbi:RimJ/RimL family protein N-acetyltransferase [Allocatelliglobosispora scoriae]|uniref:RimJ/RimL family protein N-acetyltransferase n=1 Tax=Allocatelliglobosispora scoriae TaxID=643052 RepID=A0A841BXK3_9ACTN|nr:GNAT family N-acetyltransferase [Allocatelliglobosispora scoriae]MBB5872256.1 RimJ/RimL family protein N-acetyltransferase [Allocatelliglobosispora scoriae]
MKPIFETERLVVRRWSDDPVDLARALDIYSRPEVGKWIGLDEPWRDLAEAEATLARWHAYFARHGDRYGAWAVEVRETGVVAGTLLLQPLPEPTDGEPGRGEVEVGWHFHPDSWGSGYATESARGALVHGFAAGLPEIYAIADPANSPSLAVMHRLGMTRVGRTRRWHGLESECYVIASPR